MGASIVLAVAAGCVATTDDLPPPTKWHGAALEIGHWLESTAVATPAGAKWPIVPEAAEPRFETSLYSGSSGPVLFLLELWRADGSPRWRELACQGADELIASLPKGDEPADCGLYTGLAGIGFVLDEMARATGEARYAEAARGCVRAIHQRAQVMGTGLEWGDTTDVIAGTAGIGAWLLVQYEQYDDLVARDLAVRAGRRLLEVSQRESIGRSWRMDPRFPRLMPNFSHGTAGVAWFLSRLAGRGWDERFFLAACEGGDHLLSIADRSSGGCRIHHHTPGGSDLYYLGWCHGPCGTARLFTSLASRSRGTQYADAVRGCLTSVLESGVPARLPGFWDNVSWCCGSAGVIDFLLDHRIEDPRCLPLARTLADDLLARGTRDERGLRFVQAEHRVRPERLEAQTGLMQGAAGIGLALLRLDAVERGAEGERFAWLPDAR